MPMEIKIEKGVPIPRRKNDSYPWESMKVGDSFVSEAKYNSMYGTAKAASHRTGHKYTVKAEGTGSRVWRVE